MVMLAILVLALAMPLWRTLRGLRTGQAADAASVAKPVEAPAGHPLMSAGLAAALTALFAGAYLLARPWSTDASFFPVVTSVSGLAVALLAIGADLMRWRAGTGRAQQDGDTLAVLTMFGMLIGMVALSMLVGQYIALPLTVALFLWLWAHERWIVIAAQAVAAVLILEFIFDRLLHPIWLVPKVQIF